mgnify:CR=1 FL=1
MTQCLNCQKPLFGYQHKYCSNLCQSKYQYKKYVKLWKNGLVNGSRGVSAKNISHHLARYLSEKFGEKCTLCGWNKVNPLTGRVPLEIDHINGNSDDNMESNLRLICPNCHSLSSTYRNLNKGHGRAWRTEKYIKNPTN